MDPFYWIDLFLGGTRNKKQDMASSGSNNNTSLHPASASDNVTMDTTPNSTLAPASSSNGNPESVAIVTSTPVGNQRSQSHRENLKTVPQNRSSSLEGITYEETEDSVVIESNGPSAAASMAGDDDVDDLSLMPGHVAVPILGYEVMEERSRFTVFRIQVKQGYDDSWFIFRRYSDFDHLNQKLKLLFPHFRLALPPKKWFGDNFDRNFIEDRIIGLQAFLNNIMGHKEILNSEPVKKFFCLEEPPGPHDSLEESRALCENLEEQVFGLHQQITEKDNYIERMEAELNLMKVQVENLRKALRIECKLYSKALPKDMRIHSDHVLNLVLLDVLERAKSSAKRRPLLSTTVEVPEEEDHVLPPPGRNKNHTNDNSPFLTLDNSSENASLTDSMAAMETIHMTKVPDTSVGQKRDNKVPPRTDLDQNRRLTQGGPKTGPAQLRGVKPKLESPGVETVVASSSPTPKRAVVAPSSGREMMSPGAHSVDVMTTRRRLPSDSALPTLKEDSTWMKEKENVDVNTNFVGRDSSHVRKVDLSVRPKVKTKALQRMQ